MREAGFTLIELLVTVVVLAVVAAFAIPGFQYMVHSNRVSSGRDDLLSAFQFAKAEAISLNKTVSICASSNGTACSGADWSKGWVVLQDSNSTGTPVVGSMLRVYPTVSGVNVKQVTSSGGSSYNFVRYRPTGIADGLADSLTFSFCDPDKAADPSTLIVSITTGQVRTGATADASCN